MGVPIRFFLTPGGKLILIGMVAMVPIIIAIWLLSGGSTRFSKQEPKIVESYRVANENYSELEKKLKRHGEGFRAQLPTSNVNNSNNETLPTLKNGNNGTGLSPNNSGNTNSVDDDTGKLPTVGGTTIFDPFSIPKKEVVSPREAKERKELLDQTKELLKAKAQLEEIKQKNDDRKEAEKKQKEDIAINKQILQIDVAGSANKQTTNTVTHFSPMLAFYSAPKEDTSIKPDTLYAPYGCKLKCELVTTVDSSDQNAPIIALVTEDLYHNGKVIIHAGTEIHTTTKGVLRNRIVPDESFVLVWKTRDSNNGLELKLQGKILDRDYNAKTNKYGVDDGTYGLKGTIIETDEHKEIKLYAALFAKKATEGFADYLLEEVKASSASGSTFINSNQQDSQEDDSNENALKVALAEGVSEIANKKAEDIAKAIERDGVYIRVPSGTSFYLYVTQTIRMDKATRGGTEAKKQAYSPAENDPLYKYLRSVRQQAIQERK